MLRVPVSGLALGELTLDAAASRYVARVHRCAVGDAIMLFDPHARPAEEAYAEIAAITREGVRCRVTALTAAPSGARRRITVLQGLGKGDKFDQIVRDATELGATQIVAVESTRSVVRLGDRKERRLARWQRIASEAARQCGRADAPEVAGPCPLAEALTLATMGPEDARWCLWEGGGAPIGQALRNLHAGQPLAFLVGPEGGLTTEEVQLARDRGFVVVSLGAVILRTETVAPAVLGGLLLLEG